MTVAEAILRRHTARIMGEFDAAKRATRSALYALRRDINGLAEGDVEQLEVAALNIAQVGGRAEEIADFIEHHIGWLCDDLDAAAGRWADQSEYHQGGMGKVCHDD